MGKMASRRLRVFEDDEIDAITNCYHSWRNEKSNTYEDIDGFCKAATLEEVQKQDYKLTPGIYVGVEAAEEDSEPFDEKMERLQKTLLQQFEKGDELKEKIIKDFGKV